jgi:tight adherence protein C
MTTTLFGLAGAVFAGIGLAVALLAFEQRRLAGPGAADWLALEMTGAGDGTDARVAPSFGHRVLRPLLARVGAIVVERTPAAQLERLHQQLLHAGLAGTIRAEELYALNLLAGVGSIVVAALWFVAAHPPAGLAMIGVVIAVVVGVTGPRAWLTRKVAARRASIFHDLPDALDLMVIGMEAGITFDGAVQVVTQHLDSPLSQELSRTLAEMELGLSRHDALQNLKRRVDVPELTTVVVSLLQADALGMSVSRVLRVQAEEMRAKRRQWAREKAGKLPVKILFPLIVFIFPPVFVIIIGPVAPQLSHLFK